MSTSIPPRLTRCAFDVQRITRRAPHLRELGHSPACAGLVEGLEIAHVAHQLGARSEPELAHRTPQDG